MTDPDRLTTSLGITLTKIYALLDERLPKEEPAWMRDGIIPTLQGSARTKEAEGEWDDDTEARYEREDTEARQDDRRVNVTITDVFAVPDEHGFLRINVGPETAVIDPDASNVTVTDVPDTEAERRAVQAEAERDEWREVAARYEDGRDKWQAKWRESDEARERAEAKHAALRADVENARRNPETLTRLLMRLADALDADDARTPTEGEDDEA